VIVSSVIIIQYLREIMSCTPWAMKVLGSMAATLQVVAALQAGDADTMFND
jgi:hypothetical protein